MKRPYIVSDARVTVNPNEPGLVCGLNMKQRQAGTIFDVSGNGVDLTLINNPEQASCLMGDCLSFDGVSSHGRMNSQINPSGDNTVSFWFKSLDNTTVTQGLCSVGDIPLETTPYFVIQNNAGTLQVYDNTSGYVSALATIGEGIWHHIGMTKKSGEEKIYFDGKLVNTRSVGTTGDNTYVYLGAGFANYAKCKILSFTCTNTIKDPEWFSSQYALGKRALWKTNPVNNVTGVTSGFLGETPLVVDSGSFDIVDATINNKNAKAIECVTAGFCYMPTSLFQQSSAEAARGEFEFFINKKTASLLHISFISDLTNFTTDSGYAIQLNPSERAALFRRTAGVNATLFYSDDFVWLEEEYAKLTVKISPKGDFSVYQNNEIITAISGTNPVTDTTYTESSFIGFDMDAGDRAAFGSQNGDIAITKRLLA